MNVEVCIYYFEKNRRKVKRLAETRKRTQLTLEKVASSSVQYRILADKSLLRNAKIFRDGRRGWIACFGEDSVDMVPLYEIWSV
jgi:hypothetical protein